MIMNISQRFISILIVMLLSFAMIRTAHGGPISATHDGKREQYDLLDPTSRAKFRGYFEHNIRMAHCFIKADLAIRFIKERDTGTTIQEHIDIVRGMYEETKTQPEGAVPWSLYIDYERMVRDVHRRQGRDTVRGYALNNPDIAWDREFRWCALR
jgi:hypothetical protein